MGSFASKEVFVPTSAATSSLQIVTYNTFLRPHIVQNDAQVQRARLIPKMLASFHADVLCLQECWSKFAVYNLVYELRQQGYPYIARTKKLKKFKVLHAGLMICSKHPIVEVQFVPFSSCSGPDCLATKGFLYACVRHPVLGNIHVFNIHLQFVTATRVQPYDANKLRVQAQQLQMWKTFLTQKQLPPDELVVLGGDWNFDNVNNEQEFQTLLQWLQVTLPPLVGDQKTSVDPVQNNLVGRGNEARKYGCAEVLYTGANCYCCPSRWVDFVVYSNNHKQPSEAVTTIVPVTAPPFATRWMAECTQLSDHYPVVATLTF